ncbi:MAG: chemotaxis protein CheW [Paracoccaceae bacterium]|jgi:chemotaxis signal transduction protein|nr:chemotaxis protein CheW [Paracoccaceae bacterium]
MSAATTDLGAGDGGAEAPDPSRSGLPAQTGAGEAAHGACAATADEPGGAAEPGSLTAETGVGASAGPAVGLCDCPPTSAQPGGRGTGVGATGTDPGNVAGPPAASGGQLPGAAETVAPGRDEDALLRLGIARCGSACIGIPIANLAEGCRVKSLGPLLHPAPGLLGALRLRGLLVPVFDLGAFTDRVPRRESELPDYAVILRSGHRLVGLAVDEIEGLLQARAGDIQRIRGVASEDRPSAAQGDGTAGRPGDQPGLPACALVSRIVQGSLLHADEVISVLDPERLFACPDILSVPASRRAASGAVGADGPVGSDPAGTEQPEANPAGFGGVDPGGGTAASAAGAPRHDRGRTLPADGHGQPAGASGDDPAEPRARIGPEQMGRGAEPLLTFSAGGASFGLLATAVHATVPRSPIEQNSLSGGICIGSITHHRQRIPVLRTEALTGLGTPSDTVETEIVLVRTSEEERIGLAVDTINRMIAAEAERMRPVPPAVAGGRGLFKGVISTAGDGEQIFVLDPERLSDHPDIVELSALSRRPRKERKRATLRSEIRSDVVQERLRHLVFDVGTSVAAPAVQIVRILTAPEVVTPASATTTPGVEGVFLLEGGPVLYVDLAAHLGLSSRPIDAAGSRVLLVGRGEHRVGFVVHSVDGIETSEWRREGQNGGGRIVQLGRGADRVILPAIDLHRLADRLTAPPRHSGA